MGENPKARTWICYMNSIMPQLYGYLKVSELSRKAKQNKPTISIKNQREKLLPNSHELQPGIINHRNV